ncbi:hypothetical protein AGDE_08434 [Angomonas deanei]|nr:hypothetical protein AGDE_08434 [Angomonas deanei]|eukprot:EPY32936.1 hypothetical protein AGDE_08434 [Angomonas deanei]
MDRVYVECCGNFSSAFCNWNEAFQLAWEMDDSTVELARCRQRELYRVEKAFESEAVQGTMKLVSMEKGAPRQLPKQLLCYRDKNIFYRILPDNRTGRHYVSSLRGVLQSRSNILTVPLSSFFVYKGTPVLAMALIPLPKEPTKLHGEGVAYRNEEIAAEIEFISEALNTPLPDYIIAEVYESLDGRQYVTETNVTNIALDDASLLYGPLKRPEMLAQCSCVTATCEDTLSVLQNPAVTGALRDILNVPAAQRQKLLCDTLHFHGINLCLLKGVLEAYRSCYGDADQEWAEMKSCVAVEMLARTIKQEFYLEAQSKRLGLDDVALSKCFALHLKDGLESKEEEKFIPLVMKKFAIANVNNEDAELINAFFEARDYARSAVVERVSLLVGARAALPTSAESTPTAASRNSLSMPKKSVFWVPLIAGRITPRVCDPKMILSTAPVYLTVETSYGHSLTWVQPLLARAAVWQGAHPEALRITRESVRALEKTYGASSPRCLQNQRLLCKLLFSVPTIDNIREGSAVLVAMLKGLEQRASDLTRAKFHIEVGGWLLGATRSLPSLTEEALHHYQAAGKLLPSHLRSSYGAWLFIQPSLGQLRCRQTAVGRNLTSLPPIQSLISDAVYLSKIIAPADYFVEYLWELGVELGLNGHYEEATNILTTAISMSKQISDSQLDFEALLQDTYKVYSSWDPAKYGDYCETLSMLRG